MTSQRLNDLEDRIDLIEKRLMEVKDVVGKHINWNASELGVQNVQTLILELENAIR
jgi:hypothetical protein